MRQPDYAVGKWHLSSDFVDLAQGGEIGAYPHAEFLSAFCVDGRVLVSFCDPQPPVAPAPSNVVSTTPAPQRTRFKISIHGGGDDIDSRDRFVDAFRHDGMVFHVFVREMASESSTYGA